MKPFKSLISNFFKFLELFSNRYRIDCSLFYIHIAKHIVDRKRMRDMFRTVLGLLTFYYLIFLPIYLSRKKLEVTMIKTSKLNKRIIYSKNN